VPTPGYRDSLRHDQQWEQAQRRYACCVRVATRQLQRYVKAAGFSRSASLGGRLRSGRARQLAADDDVRVRRWAILGSKSRPNLSSDDMRLVSCSRFSRSAQIRSVKYHGRADRWPALGWGQAPPHVFGTSGQVALSAGTRRHSWRRSLIVMSKWRIRSARTHKACWQPCTKNGAISKANSGNSGMYAVDGLVARSSVTLPPTGSLPRDRGLSCRTRAAARSQRAGQSYLLRSRSDRGSSFPSRPSRSRAETSTDERHRIQARGMG
jgi:hypothetical protein